EIDLLLLLAPLVHREIDDPAQFEAILLDQPKFFADLGARWTGELDEARRLAGDKEHGIAGAQPDLRAERFGLIAAKVVSDRSLSEDQLSGRVELLPNLILQFLRTQLPVGCDRSVRWEIFKDNIAERLALALP